MNNHSGGFAYARYFLCCLAMLMIFVAASNSMADGQKKNKKNADAPTAQQQLPTPTPDTQLIDNNIGGMLAAFQLGKTDMLHKYYSESATFVSGEYEPPVVGWQNYAPIYERQIAAFQSMQLNRRNTLIFARADMAWATYQWEFFSSYNGRPYTVRGQTTLIFNKVGADWLIVHNHTSQIYPTGTPTQQSAVQQLPLQQAPGGAASARP
jgi:SnoaL-like domain